MAENGDIWLGTWDKGLWVIDSRDIDRAIQTGQVGRTTQTSGHRRGIVRVPNR